MTTPVPLTVPPPSAPVLPLEATGILQVLNARRAAAPVGTCTRRENP